MMAHVLHCQTCLWFDCFDSIVCLTIALLRSFSRLWMSLLFSICHMMVHVMLCQTSFKRKCGSSDSPFHLFFVKSPVNVTLIFCLSYDGSCCALSDRFWEQILQWHFPFSFIFCEVFFYEYHSYSQCFILRFMLRFARPVLDEDVLTVFFFWWL